MRSATRVVVATGSDCMTGAGAKWRLLRKFTWRDRATFSTLTVELKVPGLQCIGRAPDASVTDVTGEQGPQRTGPLNREVERADRQIIRMWSCRRGQPKQEV